MDPTEPCEIISVQNSRIVFNRDTLVDILRECNEAVPIVIVSIVGKPQAGKSFLINLIAKYLEHNGDRKWIGAKDDKLIGFAWNPNPEDVEKEGTGISVMRQNIYGHNAENEVDYSDKTTVLLLDIDLKPGNDFNKHMAALTATCISISSLSIFVETDIGNISKLDTKIIVQLLQEIVHGDTAAKPHDIIVTWNPTVLNSSADKKILNWHPMHDLPKDPFTVSTLTLPDFRKSPRTGCFQGEPKFMLTDKLRRVIGSMVCIESLIAGSTKSKQGTPGALSLIEHVVGKVNKLLENTKWMELTNMALATPAIDNRPAKLMAADAITNSSGEQCRTNVHEAQTQVTLNKPKGIPERTNTATVSALTRKKLLQSEITENFLPEDKEILKDTNSTLLSIKPSKAQSSTALTETTTSLQPAPTHSPTRLQPQVTPQQCFEDFCKLFNSNLKFFVTPTIRTPFIQILQSHVLDKYYQNSSAGKDCASSKLLKQMVSKFKSWLSPIVEALDKSNMIIENEFDSCVYLTDSEIPQLLIRAKTFSRARFISKGDGELESYFENCWTSIKEGIQARNKRVQEFEMQKQQWAHKRVQQLYETELAKLITPTGKLDALDKLNKELEADLVGILLSLCDFKQNAAAVVEKKLRNMMTSIYKSQTAHLQRTHVPTVSKFNPLQATVQSTVSYAAAVTQNLPQTQFQSSSQLNVQLQLIPAQPVTTLKDQGTIIVVHFNRSSEMKYAVVQSGPTEPGFQHRIGKIPPFLAHIDEEIVIGKHVQHAINIQTVRPGSVTRLIINETEEELQLQYEEVIGLFLGKLKQHVEQELNELITTCVMVIPIMWSSVSRQAMRDSAGCAGFQKITLINEPTAAAATTLCSGNNYMGLRTRNYSEQEKYVLVVYFSKHDKTDFVIYVNSTTIPLLQTKSVSGNSYSSTISNSWSDSLKVWTSKHNHERYFDDVKQQACLKSEAITKLIVVGDLKSSKPSLEVDVLKKRFSPSAEINYEESVIQGAVYIAAKVGQLDFMIKECLPYRIVLQLFSKNVPIFDRHKSLPATFYTTLDISAADSKLTFDVVLFISTTKHRILGNYCITIDEASTRAWNAVKCKFDLDSFGILQVTGQLINTKSKSSKSRHVIVTRTDSMNLQQSALRKCSQNIKSWLNFTKEKQFKLNLKNQLFAYKNQLIEKFCQIRSKHNPATIEIFDNAIESTETMLTENSSGKETLQSQMLYLQKVEKEFIDRN